MIHTVHEAPASIHSPMCVCVADITDNVYVSEDVRQLSCIARIISMSHDHGGLHGTGLTSSPPRSRRWSDLKKKAHHLDQIDMLLFRSWIVGGTKASCMSTSDATLPLLVHNVVEQCHAMRPAYDFSDLFASDQHADLTLRLTTASDGSEPPAKKRRGPKARAAASTPACTTVELPGHTLVLLGCSPVFKVCACLLMQQRSAMMSWTSAAGGMSIHKRDCPTEACRPCMPCTEVFDMVIDCVIACTTQRG